MKEPSAAEFQSELEVVLPIRGIVSGFCFTRYRVKLCLAFIPFAFCFRGVTVVMDSDFSLLNPVFAQFVDRVLHELMDAALETDLRVIREETDPIAFKIATITALPLRIIPLYRFVVTQTGIITVVTGRKQPTDGWVTKKFPEGPRNLASEIASSASSMRIHSPEACEIEKFRASEKSSTHSKSSRPSLREPWRCRWFGHESLYRQR